MSANNAALVAAVAEVPVVNPVLKSPFLRFSIISNGSSPSASISANLRSLSPSSRVLLWTLRLGLLLILFPRIAYHYFIYIYKFLFIISRVSIVKDRNDRQRSILFEIFI